MNKLTVGLAQRSYDIDVDYACLEKLGQRLLDLSFPRRIVIITNTTVNPLYGDVVTRSLTGVGFGVDSIVVADGEEYKTSQTLDDIYTQLIELKCDRSSGIVALGGGVVGDMAGYAAATFLRGIPFVQVPTTLLSQVDSSVGGKTAINHPLGKNMIGAFYQPRYVLIDVKTLDSLDKRNFISGFAEIIKYGMIYNGEFFSWLEANIDALVNYDRDALIAAITRSCQIKARVVEADETEHFVRAILNYGHTFGHAVEQLSGYGTVLHGEAVAIGMVVAAKLAKYIDLCSGNDVDRLVALLLKCGLPVEPPQFDLSRYIEAMSRDKKVQDGVLRMVFNRGIGGYEIRSLLHPEESFAAIDVLMPQT
ncbi:MAG: 3-dehydroquinate synthase [Thermodesulfobacteriota bacterium]|nr:3-dehydroquinate synthase [Thermodesulfobacteriota bacterium]